MPTYEKCRRDGCENLVKRFPMHVRDGSHIYCSHACAKELRKRDWKPVKDFLIANLHTMTVAECAVATKTHKRDIGYLIREIKDEGGLPDERIIRGTIKRCKSPKGKVGRPRKHKEPKEKRPKGRPKGVKETKPRNTAWERGEKERKPKYIPKPKTFKQPKVAKVRTLPNKNKLEYKPKYPNLNPDYSKGKWVRDYSQPGNAHRFKPFPVG